MRTLGDVVERNERVAPDALAMSFESRNFTNLQLTERARRLANALYARGLRHQDRIAILAQNCPEFIDAFTAGYLTGFITVTVNHRLAAPEIEFILNDCRPAAVIFDASVAPTLAQVRDQLASVRSFIGIGDAPEWAERYDAVLANSLAEPLPLRPAEGDIAYLLYTSGTTGRPKGVMLSHRGQLAAAENYCIEGMIEDNDRPLIAAPLYHGGGRWTQIAHAWRGCPVFIHRAFDARAILTAIAQDRITSMFLPPSMLQRVMDVPDFASFDRSSLRTIYYASAPMPVPLLRRAIGVFGPIFIQHYGLTEAGGIGTVLRKNEHVLDGPERITRRLGSAGLAKVTAAVRVVGDDGVDCKLGENGEILIRSPAVMTGYWSNDAATREALQDGWLHSGDIGHFDEDGFLYVVDRIKDMIISGGVNIYSREVEDALMHHPAVHDAAVIAKPDRDWGESVHAFVVLRPGAAATADELIEHCRTRIASFKKPKSLDIVPDLPRLPNGKTNKRVLREPFWTGHDRRVS